VRQAYRERGYFMAETSDPTTHDAMEGGLNWFTLRPSTGSASTSHAVDEGDRYKLAESNFPGSIRVSGI